MIEDAGLNERITKDLVLAVSRHDTTVARCVQMCSLGMLTWEEAMMLAVVALSRQNKVLLDAAVQAEWNAPFIVDAPPGWTPK